MSTEPCTVCYGKGKRGKGVCPACKGSGKIDVKTGKPVAR